MFTICAFSANSALSQPSPALRFHRPNRPVTSSSAPYALPDAAFCVSGSALNRLEKLDVL